MTYTKSLEQSCSLNCRPLIFKKHFLNIGLNLSLSETTEIENKWDSLRPFDIQRIFKDLWSSDYPTYEDMPDNHFDSAEANERLFAGMNTEDVDQNIRLNSLIASTKDSSLDYKIQEELESETIQFPLHVYPPMVQQWLREVSASVRRPIDFAACSLIPIVSTFMAGSQIELKPDWSERPNFYLIIASITGGGKTPAIKKVMRFVYKREGEYAKQYKTEIEEYEETLLEWEKQSKKQRGRRPELPPYHSILTTDPTVEALAPLLSNNKGILLHRDEVSGWIKSFDQYRGGKGTDREAFLGLWSGGYTKIDRKGKPPIRIEDPCLNILGGIVPKNIHLLIPNTDTEDGLLERILFCYPQPTPGMWSDDLISKEAQDEMERIFTKLSTASPRNFKLDEAAKNLFISWHDQIQEELETKEGHIRGFYEKLKAHTARFLIPLAGLWETSGEVVDETMMVKAIDLARYFRAHTLKAHKQLYHSPEKDQTEAIVTWAKNHEETRIKPKHLYRAGLPGCPNARAALEKMQELVTLEKAVWIVENKEIQLL